MQGVAQAVLDRARALLPVRRVAQPVGVVGDVGPGPDVGQARDQGVDVAIGALEARHLVGDPVGRQPAAVGELAEHGRQEVQMRLIQGLAEVRDLADRPQQAHAGRRRRALAHLRPAAQHLQADVVEGVAGALQAGEGRRRVERGEQALERAEVERGAAPAQLPERREVVTLDRLDGLGVEPADVLGRAEGAVLHVAAGAAGDLRDLLRVQRPPLLAVELDQARQRDVADVHVEAHADRVGRDQIVDFARLIEGDLGVASTRAEGAEHDRSTAALAPDQLGERIDLLGGERDDGAAARQPGDLGGRRVSEVREPGPGDHLGLGDQLLEQRPDGVGAEEHGLVAAAGAQQPVGEHVAALGIGAQLDLVDREEGGLEILRHRLDGGDEVAGRGRLDALLAGNQSDRGGALLGHHPVIDLAREQAQRTTDQAAPVGQHPLDREVGLAGVGRPEHGQHARAFGWQQRHVSDYANAGRP